MVPGSRRRPYSSYLILLAAVLWLPACAGLERLAVPESQLIDPALIRTSESADDVIDHAALDQFLQRYVIQDSQGVNRVAYSQVSAADRQRLDDYIDRLSRFDAANLVRDEQLAYWVNLYNARTLTLILDHYPVRSIRDIRSGFLSIGPWNDPLLTVRDRVLSLNDIEHGIIRPGWQEPRIHYVINCAAIGCPNLGLQAYTGDTIDDLMTEAAEAYVNDPRGAQFTPSGDLLVSKIYLWFREDFGEGDTAVLDELRRYAAPALRDRLSDRRSIDGYVYDWGLNDSPGIDRQVQTSDSLPDAGAVRVVATQRPEASPHDRGAAAP